MGLRRPLVSRRVAVRRRGRFRLPMDKTDTRIDTASRGALSGVAVHVLGRVPVAAARITDLISSANPGSSSTVAKTP
jgi:hypothetical protein